MTGVLYLIEQIAPGLYILLAVGLYVYWRRWTSARYAHRSTYFELERDIFRHKQSGAFTTMIVLVQLLLLVFGIQNVVVPAIRAQSKATVGTTQVLTDGVVNSPTPPPFTPGRSPIDASGVQIGEATIGGVVATPTLTPTPVGTILPNPPPVAGCDTADATLQVPANGMLVFEPLTVIGTANAMNFAFYRFEINGPQTFGNYAPIGEYTQPVPVTNPLGQFIPASYLPGEYKFRLTVFDIDRAFKAACEVTITISDPIPTATPLQQG